MSPPPEPPVAPIPAPSDAAPARAETGPRREMTVRAVVTALVVAALIGASYPYVVLKIGYGPNISVVSAFFGFLALSAISFFTKVRGTRFENNLVQTAGTAAGEMGFMCILLAAIDMLNGRPGLGFSLHLSPLQIFAWLSVSGMLGVLLAVPLRRHYIEEEQLTFADGTAAGETMLVLDMDRGAARTRVRALLGGLGVSSLVTVLRERPLALLPSEIAFSPALAAVRMGTSISLLSLGGGLLVGLRITLSMALGSFLAWVVAPDLLVAYGAVETPTFRAVLFWIMWPATGLLVSGGITALVLKWRVIASTFTRLHAADVTARDDEFPLAWVGAGLLVLTVLLCVVQKVSLDFPVWMTLVSLALSIPLLLVGTRVLGETNWAPISSLANLMQAVFAAIAPGSMAANMIGSGMSGTVASNGEHLMQDYKAGHIVGANNRHLTIMQLLAIPVGAAAVAVAYPALASAYGIGGDHGLSAPASVRWAGFAELLGKGWSALPPGCFVALAIAFALGVVLTVLEQRGDVDVPSPTGVGLGMLIPGYEVVPMVVGGLLQWAWAKWRPRQEEAIATPLASGFIAGEALVVLVISVLLMLGVKL